MFIILMKKQVKKDIALNMIGECTVLKFVSTLKIYLIGFYVCVALAKVEICFPNKGIYKGFHPPAVSPADPSLLIYSVSVDMMIPQPIIAQLCEEGCAKTIPPTHQDYSYSSPSRVFSIASIDPNVAGRRTKDFVKDKLVLCRESSNEFGIYSPRSYEVHKTVSRVECADGPENSVLKIEYQKNVLVAYGLFHKLSDTSVDTERLVRVLRFSYETKDGQLIYKDTEPIEIFTNPAVSLKWLEKPPSIAIANTPYVISLEIVDKARTRVKDGIDSTLFVEVAIHYSDELDEPKSKVAQSSSLYKKTNLLQRAAGGVVNFTNLMFIYDSRKAHVNVTLIDPWPHTWRYSDNKLMARGCSLRSRGDTVNCVPSVTPPPSIVIDLKNVYAKKGAKLALQEPPMALRTVTIGFAVPNIVVEILDRNDRRVSSGPHSALFITVKTIPQMYFKPHSYTETSQGLGNFSCFMFDTANISFIFEASAIGANVTSSLYTITREINIALFADLSSNDRIYGHAFAAATLARFAIEDINDGMYSDTLTNLKDLDFKLQIIDTEDDFGVTAIKFSEMVTKTKGGNNPDVKAIIGFGSNKLLSQMDKCLEIRHIPVISYTETTDEISEQRGTLPSVTSVRWNSVSVALNLVLMMNSRNWKKIVIIVTESHPIPRPIYQEMSIFHIDYQVIVIPDLPETSWTENGLSEELGIISTAGTKIIFHYIFSPLQYFLYRQAIKFHCASIDGYQWITIEQPDQQYRWDHEHPLCQKDNSWCNKGMEGIILIRGTYDISNITNNWRIFNINQRYFGMDRVYCRGVPTSRTRADNAVISLAYDAVLVLAHAFNAAYKKKTLITNEMMVKEINKVQADGLTGQIKFTDHRRAGFMGKIYQVQQKMGDSKPWKEVRLVNTPPRLDIFFTSYEEGSNLQELRTSSNNLKWKARRRSHVDFDILLTPHEWQYEMPLSNRNSYKPSRHSLPSSSVSSDTLPSTTISSTSSGHQDPFVSTPTEFDRLNSPFYFRYYLSKTEELRASSPKDCMVLRTECVRPAFTCERGCGGQQLHATDVVHYQHGTCVAQNECKCQTLGEYYKNDTPDPDLQQNAFYGEACEVQSCRKCVHGFCAEPDSCSCHTGWSGAECLLPICRAGCLYGKCTHPDNCECDLGYHGTKCNFMAGAFVVAAFCIIGFFMFLAYLWIMWCHKSKKTQRELKNMDWLVDWKDVIEKIPDRASNALTPQISDLSSSSSASSRPQVDNLPSIPEGIIQIISSQDGYKFSDPEALSRHFRYVHWKDQDCYVQNFDRPSLNLNDMQILKEIAQMKQTRHSNLVRFVGICPTWPDVCILVEYVPKGSLAQILQQTTFTLTWYFKYSILRDICSGMEYLHASSIYSHGRLKSSNCLIDNRWTCKVSGFGIPTIRKMEYSVDEFQTMRQSMLWTAPELLRMFSTPAGVGTGTKVGDAYSFGIIMTELCTHEKPWTKELGIIDLEDLIQVVKSINSANDKTKESLANRNYDTRKPLRPYVNPALLPKSYGERKALLKLIDDLLHEDFTRRPSFMDTLAKLNMIHPLKGELVEHLIYMLEEYTNHMEEILANKMKEVQIEKTKTEELIARLLPESIAEQLKQNKQVVPQKHDNVTIFFSDIKGFTAIAKDSKPMQVVKLLNDLYTMFDSVIERYNAYKLETIGDAYCVVSGIPLPNRNHAQDIVTMAMEISARLNRFRIRHLPGRLIECRIGINSGSVVAGVLGVKMPRYCIFGLDVVIASLMESSGEIRRVHVSANTANYIKGSPIFTLEDRGEMELKYVGQMKTYFVGYRLGVNPIALFSIFLSPGVSPSVSSEMYAETPIRRKSSGSQVLSSMLSMAKSVESSVSGAMKDRHEKRLSVPKK